ncbi:hypothetical protein [Bartonella bacilliformis]|nr:hypothetical protein [Bartonella bacilliformis]
MIYFSHHTTGYITIVELGLGSFAKCVVHLKNSALRMLSQTQRAQVIFDNIAKNIIFLRVVMVFALNRIVVANLRILLDFYVYPIIIVVFEKNFLKKSDAVEVGRLMYLQMMFIAFAVVAMNVTDRLIFPRVNNDDN